MWTKQMIEKQYMESIKDLIVPKIVLKQIDKYEYSV